MRTGRPLLTLTVSDEERQTLERWARRPKTAQALARRAEVVLGAAAGERNSSLFWSYRPAPLFHACSPAWPKPQPMAAWLAVQLLATR
jgi:hypothetical protein